MSRAQSDWRRRTGRGLALLAAALTAAACGQPIEDAAQVELELEPQPAVASEGPPTTLRLVLQLEGDRFRLISADPRRGNVSRPDIEARSDDLLDGSVRLIAYSATDAAGLLLASGFFIVPMQAVTEFQDLSVETRVRRRTEPLVNPTVRVGVPYSEAISTLSFDALEPRAEIDPRKWPRVPMGRVSLADPGQDEPGMSEIDRQEPDRDEPDRDEPQEDPSDDVIE